MKPQEELPLTEATFYILLSLAEEPQHGYAIMKQVELLSDDRVKLSTGTLYGALKRLLGKGWITRMEEIGPVDGRDRKRYALTEVGRTLLAAEIRRMEDLVRVARLKQQRGEI